MKLACGVALFAAAIAVLPARPTAQTDRRDAYDEILDLNVRDGMVYYRALKASRARLDTFVNSLASRSIESAPRGEQIAFWLNAYNAIVLQTVIDNYPIPQRSRDYPAGSIRQIPGAFEKQTHRVAGRTLTLDEIETMLQAFEDPRVFFALGRGAIGGGRLHSAAYTAGTLEQQLTDVAGECVTRVQCADVDRIEGIVKVNAIFSWREKEFTAGYADKAPALFASRSPIERAVLAFVYPRLLTTEREFLEANTFRVRFAPFDWTLNDLTGRGGR